MELTHIDENGNANMVDVGNKDILKRAFEATCKKRETENLKKEGFRILNIVKEDVQLHNLWKSYQRKYQYAIDISYEDVMESIEVLLKLLG